MTNLPFVRQPPPKFGPAWDVSIKFQNDVEIGFFVKAPADTDLLDFLCGTREMPSPLVDGILNALKKSREEVKNVASLSVKLITFGAEQKPRIIPFSRDMALPPKPK